MDLILESLCKKKVPIDTEARLYAYAYSGSQIEEAIEYHQEEESDIVDMIEQDFNRQLHNEETINEYADALYRVRRIIFHLRARSNKDESMDELMESFQEMAT
jgi:6-phosphogluconate dehydrogenase